MKTITLALLVSSLALSGLALASQSGGEGRDRSMMERMTNGETHGERMMGMMDAMGQMSKMMDRCSAMMESMKSAHGSEQRTQER
jgi:hypothetical protein